MSLVEPKTTVRYVIANSEQQAVDRVWHTAWSEADLDRLDNPRKKKPLPPMSGLYEVTLTARRIAK